MKSSATYAISLFTLISILTSGCSADSDIAQAQGYQQRAVPLYATLKPISADYKSSLQILELDEENIIAPPKTYSF